MTTTARNEFEALTHAAADALGGDGDFDAASQALDDALVSRSIEAFAASAADFRRAAENDAGSALDAEALRRLADRAEWGASFLAKYDMVDTADPKVLYDALQASIRAHANTLDRLAELAERTGVCSTCLDAEFIDEAARIRCGECHEPDMSGPYA